MPSKTEGVVLGLGKGLGTSFGENEKSCIRNILQKSRGRFRDRSRWRRSNELKLSYKTVGVGLGVSIRVDWYKNEFSNSNYQTKL